MMQGGNFVSGAVSAVFGSLGAAGFGAAAGEFAKTAEGIVLSGAVLGGVGAELTGGNFWQGALVGGMVAGLNHAMHRISDSEKLNQFLVDNGIDPHAEATQGALNKYKVIFKEYWDGSAKWAEFANDATISEWEKGDVAKLSISINGRIKVNSEGSAWGVTNSLGQVILAPGLLSRNNYKLATIFIHEMQHSVDYVSGFYNFIYQHPNVEHIMEYRAYYETYKWTGVMEQKGLYHKSNLGYVPFFLLNHH